MTKQQRRAVLRAAQQLEEAARCFDKIRNRRGDEADGLLKLAASERATAAELRAILHPPPGAPTPLQLAIAATFGKYGPIGAGNPA